MQGETQGQCYYSNECLCMHVAMAAHGPGEMSEEKIALSSGSAERKVPASKFTRLWLHLSSRGRAAAAEPNVQRQLWMGF